MKNLKQNFQGLLEEYLEMYSRIDITQQQSENSERAKELIEKLEDTEQLNKKDLMEWMLDFTFHVIDFSEIDEKEKLLRSIDIKYMINYIDISNYDYKEGDEKSLIEYACDIFKEELQNTNSKYSEDIKKYIEKYELPITLTISSTSRNPYF